MDKNILTHAYQYPYKYVYENPNTCILMLIIPTYLIMFQYIYLSKISLSKRSNHIEVLIYHLT